MKVELDKFLPFRHRGARADLDLNPLQFEDIERTWEQIPRLFRALARLPSRWEELFGPLRVGKIDDLMVAGQIGQSLDGRVATTTGRSHYINCPAALEHLHRLRALVDAVVVGVETACRDDPQLTVAALVAPIRYVSWWTRGDGSRTVPACAATGSNNSGDCRNFRFPSAGS